MGGGGGVGGEDRKSPVLTEKHRMSLPRMKKKPARFKTRPRFVDVECQLVYLDYYPPTIEKAFFFVLYKTAQVS